MEPEPKPESERIVQSDPRAQDPDYAKFFKLLKLGMDADHIKLKMTAEGFDPSVLDSAVQSSSQSTNKDAPRPIVPIASIKTSSIPENAPSIPPPPPPQMQPPHTATSSVQSLPNPTGRRDLLSSIQGFSKNNLKKSKTVDKSAPRI